MRILAVGGRQPVWVDEAYESYASRLPADWRFELKVLPSANRPKKRAAEGAVEREGQSMLAAIRNSERVVALDEGGREFDSLALAERLGTWLAGGEDLCFLIGGPDGLSADCLERAAERWSLAKLTLPHGLVRVIVAEQLYRAWTVRTGHPYHRG